MPRIKYWIGNVYHGDPFSLDRIAGKEIKNPTTQGIFFAFNPFYESMLMKIPWRTKRRAGRQTRCRRSAKLLRRIERLEPRCLLSAEALLITEFMASNNDAFLDGDGSYSDWIEIHNPGLTGVDLGNYFLTDDPDQLEKWSLPDILLPNGGYLIVFASAPDDGMGGVLDNYIDAGGYYHTNFKLDADGEYLALVYQDPATFETYVVFEYSPEFPAQQTDISYGIQQTNQTLAGPGSAVHYIVPTDDSLGTSWTDSGFDDSTWTNMVDTPPATVVITELGVGNLDWVEIQNVSDQEINTLGWCVAFNNPDNGDINQVYSYCWNFSSSLPAGQVLYTNEYQNGLGSISWSATEPGWVMLIDNTGRVRDVVLWGYTENHIASFNTSVNGFSLTADDLPWSDSAVSGLGGLNVILSRTGNSDHNSATDFTAGSEASQGSQNPSLLIPFVSGESIPATLGVGYETNPTGSSAGQDLTNLAPKGVATQSSLLASYTPDRAIDGSYDNFTHTYAGQNLPSWWQVDLGNSYVLEQITLHNRTGCCQSRLRDITVQVLDSNQAVVFTSSLLNPENAGYSYPSGPATLSLDLVELAGGSPVIGQTIRITRTPDPDLSGTAGQGNNDEADVLSLGEVEILGYDLLSYEQIYQVDLLDDLFGQNGSVYLRAPFSMATDPASFDQLLLRMQYDDGFIAYLNGTKIAERNAPVAPLFNATAMANRDDELAIQFETINISDHLGLLQQGDNILAIHGLNLAADDEDFLIVPELVGVTTTMSFRYFDEPTPGCPNNNGYAGIIADTQFSVDRGIYDTPFQLMITSTTPGAEIYYTTDGLPPTPASSTRYTEPLTISATTVLRAAAFKEDYLPTNVDTQTYIFPNDVVQQGYQATLDAGFPATWGGTSPDYGLDTDVIGTFDASGNPLGGDLFGGIYAATIQDDLKSIPTMSIVMDIDDLFGPNGIYTNSTASGFAWERPTSIELINPDGSTGFQVDAGLRIHGGYFRQHSATRKHSFRLVFRDEYGPTLLQYPLFGTSEGAVAEFDTIVLRAGANDGYSWDAARFTEQYTRDEFGRSLQLATGNPSAHGMFVHLYINGMYWGLYNPVERPDNDFSASYLGGDPDHWDAVHVTETTEGDFVAWDAMLAKTQQAGSSLAAYMELQGLNLDGTPHETIAPLLDVQNYIDYITVNVWGGNWDWPWKNWWAGRDRDETTTTGFQLYNWDYENTMGNNRDRSPLDATTLDQDFSGSRNAGQPHSNLVPNAEYRILFADRIHQFFFNDGILTPGKLIERYQQIADQVERAMVGESARWGDMHYSTPLTLAEWTTERDWILNAYLPQRSNIVLQELKNANLYPSTVAPSFNQHGGRVASGFDLTITAPAGTIYYTLDGSDPRAIGGGISASAIQYTGAPLEITSGILVRARAIHGSDWSALNEATFIVAAPADATNLRITEINYHPSNPTPAELIVDPSLADHDFEFIELQNTGTTPIDVTGVQFLRTEGEGIDFDFTNSTITELEPGAFLIVVENLVAFAIRYGTDLLVAGQWSGGLSDGGERLTLRDAADNIIHDFTYDDADGWPTTPDGNGPTLEVIDVFGDYTDPANWRGSSILLGTPGSAAFVSGDYDLDHDVDRDDLNRWQAGFGLLRGANITDGDSDADGDVDGTDFLAWQCHFGSDVTAGSGAIHAHDAGGSGTVEMSETLESMNPGRARLLPRDKSQEEVWLGTSLAFPNSERPHPIPTAPQPKKQPPKIRDILWLDVRKL
ncbi:MAG: lamin tail domain-containing protein [Pirellulales bacterium]|nr:lamin tail domain-containing protein [Pirellulales bacterium]